VTVLGTAARGAAWLTRASVALAAALMLLAIFYQAVLRYVFGDTPAWSEEVAVLLFGWTVLGGLVGHLPRGVPYWLPGKRRGCHVSAAEGAAPRAV